MTTPQYPPYYALLVIFKWTPSMDYLLPIKEPHYRQNPDRSIESAWTIKAHSKDALFALRDAMQLDLIALFDVKVDASNGRPCEISVDEKKSKSILPFDFTPLNLNLRENSLIAL